MDRPYIKLSTSLLETMLERAAAGSAEHRALQEEVRARQGETFTPKPKRDRTLPLPLVYDERNTNR